MTDSYRRNDAMTNEPAQDPASEEAASRVGRMTPIDPGVGAGGTLVSDATTGNSDVASGGDGATGWSGGMVTTGRAGVVDPDDDTPLNERRNDTRDPGAEDARSQRWSHSMMPDSITERLHTACYASAWAGAAILQISLAGVILRRSRSINSFIAGLASTSFPSAFVTSTAWCTLIQAGIGSRQRSPRRDHLRR